MDSGIEGLTEGRIVHYVLPHGRSVGQHRPAIVVRVWNDEDGCSNLVVFVDGTNDGEDCVGCILWATSRLHSDDHEPGTWHFPEEV